ncbi:trans-aconitate 2-methyltransferase [Arthrobacter sp. Br18]|uniref:trans-aconitate 2-methyltransferase n=1 Tax=Arthrobacter sp. Br18 TaxID=1312954 RepID=UPI00047BFABD|nr:trans-aconitate 2-methyltransferase [Arthrobacter sp. Br18]
MTWNPAKYAQYADHRGRPFFDLVSRIDSAAPRRVVDLGCGPGELTAALAARWPDAEVVGIDSSAEMIEAAGATTGAPGNLRFAIGELREWTPGPDDDVVVTNAALQWIPEHRELLPVWAAAMPTGSWFALQVPGNFRAPSHVLMREHAATPAWKPLLGGVLRHENAVGEPNDYLQLFSAAGLRVDAWETTYLQVLQVENPVLEWVRGTGLRPVLSALSPEQGAAFEDGYGALLREAYPRSDAGTVFPFRRIFAVGQKLAD